MFKDYKEETMIKARSLIDSYKEEYNKNLELECNLLKDKISVKFCEEEEEKSEVEEFKNLLRNSLDLEAED